MGSNNFFSIYVESVIWEAIDLFIIAGIREEQHEGAKKSIL